jgi:hypothetical protein
MKRVLSEGQFRGLIRDLVKEYVANDDGNPHKDVHADPTGVAWDSGLDEEMTLDEADEDHEGDPRWDEKGDPTQREKYTGLGVGVKSKK